MNVRERDEERPEIEKDLMGSRTGGVVARWMCGRAGGSGDEARGHGLWRRPRTTSVAQRRLVAVMEEVEIVGSAKRETAMKGAIAGVCVKGCGEDWQHTPEEV